MIAQAYPAALRKAALEAFEGQYTTKQLDEKVNRAMIQESALKQIFSL